MKTTDYFYFDKMITPKLINILYWILLLANVGFGFHTMFNGFYGFSFGNFLKGLAFILIGAVLVRLWCELMIVIFKINDNLQKIVNEKDN